MKTLKFMGHSDDTFGEYGTTMDDIDNAGSGEPIQCVIEADGTALIVTGQYDRNGTGTWDIGISLLMSDTDMLYTAGLEAENAELKKLLRSIRSYYRENIA